MFGSPKQPGVTDVRKVEKTGKTGTQLKVVVKLPGCTIRIQGWRITVSN